MASGLGGLLGAYGSDEEDEQAQEQQGEETQQTGQVTLLREDSGGGLDLSHLTSGPATRQAEEETEGGKGATGDQQQQRPRSAASDQQGDGIAGPALMDADGQLQAAGGGGEQPPAEADPLSMLPPEMREPPEGECDPAVQARVANWLHLQRTRGKYINEEIRKSRGYRNPEFFAKMVEHLEIKQYGTSFAPEVFDPSALPPEDFLDALQREWAAEEERRKAARAAGQGRVEFQKSASQPSLVQQALKPGLQQPTLQPTPPAYPPPPGSVAAAAAQAKAAAAAAAAQQQPSHAGLSAAAAVAAAQAKAAQLAAQLQRDMQRR